ncbi:MAG: hypothetical protein JOZ41_12185 [Chloroflexi bacterium]|nr:hypothetical protein [Chloroflexota bacterium]
MAKFRGGPDPDLYQGGADADLITGGGGNDTLGGGRGDDTLRGNAGDDDLFGGGGNDILAGGTGDDLLRGRGSSDTLFGGSGDDSLIGGAGRDTATYAGADSGVTVDLRLAGEAQDTHGAGVDVLVGIDDLRGSSLDDRLIGDGQANELFGGAGNDVLIGGHGSDTLDGGLGADTLQGGAGADVYRFESLQFVSDQPTGLIKGLTTDDVINLQAVDANINEVGDQAFMLVDGLTGTAGQLALTYNPDLGVTLALADIDGDGQADYALYLQGDKTDFTNFIL